MVEANILLEVVILIMSADHINKKKILSPENSEVENRETLEGEEEAVIAVVMIKIS